MKMGDEEKGGKIYCGDSAALMFTGWLETPTAEDGRGGKEGEEDSGRGSSGGVGILPIHRCFAFTRAAHSNAPLCVFPYSAANRYNCTYTAHTNCKKATPDIVYKH